jgi:hypothetical protein
MAEPKGQETPPNNNTLPLNNFRRGENVDFGRVTASDFSPTLSIGNVR